MGTITVSDNAVTQIVAYALKDCDGFAGMSDKSRASETARKVSGNETGVRVLKTKNGIKLDVYIACKHGADTKTLSAEAAECIQNAFPITGIKIGNVVVHINDVR